MIRGKAQTFEDGTVRIYAVSGAAAAGDLPRGTLKLIETLRFQRRTVGVTRSYLAMQAGAEVDGLIRCPYRETVSAHDAAEIGGTRYRVETVQRPQDVTPPVMDLTLKRWAPDDGA